MIKHISKYLTAAAALLLFAACEKEAELTVLEKVQFTAPPVASTTAVVVTPDNMEETVFSLNWPAVTYPVTAPVLYTVQFTTLNDTLTATPWANAVDRAVGEDVLNRSFTAGELNEIATELGLEPGVESTLVARVVSFVDRNVFSKAIALQLTPYEVPPLVVDYPALWIAGDFQGWNIGEAAKIVSVKDDGVYEGYIYIPAGGTNEFKIYAQPDWSPTSYGTEVEGELIVANFAGANFVAPSDGYYFFAVNLNTMTYLLEKMSWGLIGGATPGGWDADTPMTFDPTTQTWSVTADMKAEGSFKFRANNAWRFDFGIDADGKLAYANHPWLEYVDQPQLTVPSDGNYTITLDLHVPGNYTYKIKKN